MGFGAILTRSDEDRVCPEFVGTDERLSIEYRDPENLDCTDHWSETYHEICRLMTREMFDAFFACHLVQTA